MNRLRDIVILAKEITFITPPPTTATFYLKSVSSIIIVVCPKEKMAPPYDAKPLTN
jgi:TRAP-type mannitol/chloroaromatic compound transport system permease large subunit